MLSELYHGNCYYLQNTYCSRLMRAMTTMARREGKEGALHFFSLQHPTDVSMSS